MWPWEHLAAAYICYSALIRVVTGSPPDWRETLALTFGTLFPDLIDKPLAWEIGLLPTGTSLAHSLFTAVPVSVLAVVLGRHWNVPNLGIAFAIGYLLHLPGDMIYPVLYGGKLWTEFLFWPLIPTQPGNVTSFIYEFNHLVARTIEYMSSPAGQVYIAFEIGLLVSAAIVWYADGMPVADVVRTTLARVRTQV